MASFFDHLAELRSKLLWCLIAVVAGVVVAHQFHEALIAFLLRPLRGERLFFLSPLDPLLFVFKIDVFAGLILALPVINWSALSFIRPALSRVNWVLFSLLYGAAALLVIGGLAYAYLVMVPLTLRFLTSLTVPGVENMITATSYLNFLLTQSLIVAAVFQIPLFVTAGSYIGALDVAMLASRRRYIYVAGLIALAVITPTTDLFSLSVVAVPAAIVFEGSLVAGRVVKWMSRNRRGLPPASAPVSGA
jgi:sec-independent protein translocase protein TatC